ncbi:unnamed protein product [Ambrosiozyma monospora]|uniref:Unnamed protein product n=1 Tax=Ambrosiozyma monospora TaxID=43982 RepID=A0A9W7DIJ3_AMBMO|nr:unnamed protein product [Ambrosiozyma monospora]
MLNISPGGRLPKPKRSNSFKFTFDEDLQHHLTVSSTRLLESQGKQQLQEIMTQILSVQQGLDSMSKLMEAQNKSMSKLMEEQNKPLLE